MIEICTDRVPMMRGRCLLTRSQSNDLIVNMLTTQPFIVAHWKFGEPIIDGYGATAWVAKNRARLIGAPNNAELCTRVVGETMVWQGPSGRCVTIEDFLIIDD